MRNLGGMGGLGQAGSAARGCPAGRAAGGVRARQTARARRGAGAGAAGGRRRGPRGRLTVEGGEVLEVLPHDEAQRGQHGHAAVDDLRLAPAAHVADSRALEKVWWGRGGGCRGRGSVWGPAGGGAWKRRQEGPAARGRALDGAAGCARPGVRVTRSAHRAGARAPARAPKARRGAAARQLRKPLECGGPLQQGGGGSPAPHARSQALFRSTHWPGRRGAG